MHRFFSLPLGKKRKIKNEYFFKTAPLKLLRSHAFYLLVVLAVFLAQPLSAQLSSKRRHIDTSAFAYPDTFQWRRFVPLQSAIAGMGLGTLWYLNKEWYAQFPQTSFHYFNDDYEWLQMDKYGHVFSAYFASNLSYHLYRSTGMSNVKATTASWLCAMAYQGIIEYLDGHSQNWGFSKGDMKANLAGASFFAAQQYLWKEQRIQIKFGFYPKKYSDEALNARTRQIFGAQVYEQLIKDYNAQSYWLSANLYKLFQHPKLPKWLNVAIGYSGEHIFEYALRNQWNTPQNQWVDRSNLPAYRQFILAPDIDLGQLPFRNKRLKKFCSLLTFKVPMPALIYSTEGSGRFSFGFF
jgi:hypothetical protein